uniref:pentatricopeptide repeat-containing protein At1g63330-like isoform X2 n=1 Tax=Erigeron canadensis TaxID=72917 RepID=UPI001CB8E322|nr:pentatricopeptide repeat-containing protein At1g63330-like isoform X2 [Erigeron canadensis]
MAARSRIQALLKSANRFLVPANSRLSSPLKSLFASSSRSLYYRHRRSRCMDLEFLSDAYYAFYNLLEFDAYYAFPYSLPPRGPPPSVVEFNNLLDIVTKLKYYSHVFEMFHRMCDHRFPVDEHTISILTKCYSGVYETENVFILLGFCLRRDIQLSLATYNTILSEFIKGDATHKAEKLFKKFIKNKFLEPNKSTYNTMIRGLCKIGNHFKAIALLRLMDGRGFNNNLVAYNTIIDSLCKDMMIDDAFRLFDEMKFRRGIRPNVFTYNSLLYALSMSGRWKTVCRILKEMHDEEITIHWTTFNLLIKALCKQGKMEEAEIVDFMMVYIVDRGCCRNVETYTSLVDGYCLNGELNRAMSTLESMERDQLYPTLHIYNRLLDSGSNLDDMNFWSYKRDLDSMYARAGLKIRENSVTHYIWDRERMEKPSDKMKLLMQDQKYSVYILSLMDHCGKYEVDAALDLFYYMNGKELNLNVDVYNILIDVSRICGRFDISRSLFHDLIVKGLEPNLDTYMLMIRGFCEQGLLKDAKKLFLKMEKCGLQPKSSINDDDIIQEYTGTKPIDHMTKLFIEMKRRGYSKRVDNCCKFVAR